MKTFESLYENFIMGNEIVVLYIAFVIAMLVAVVMIRTRKKKRRVDMAEVKDNKHTCVMAMDIIEGTPKSNHLFSVIKIQPSDNAGAIVVLNDRTLVFSKEMTPKIGEAITAYFEELIK